MKVFTLTESELRALRLQLYVGGLVISAIACDLPGNLPDDRALTMINELIDDSAPARLLEIFEMPSSLGEVIEQARARSYDA